jgi:hypothetical protein
MRLHLVSDKERNSVTSTITTKTITTIIKVFFCLGDKGGKLCNLTLDFEEQ